MKRKTFLRTHTLHFLHRQRFIHSAISISTTELTPESKLSVHHVTMWYSSHYCLILFCLVPNHNMLNRKFAMNNCVVEKEQKKEKKKKRCVNGQTNCIGLQTIQSA